MPYADLTAAEGRRHLPRVWNLFFKPLTEQDFFVEPWERCGLGDCAEFRMGNGENGSDEVLFFVTDPELIRFLLQTTEELYLFGAYNQVTVCQMRARGTVVQVTAHPEIEKIRASRHAAIELSFGRPTNGPQKKEAEERYALLNHGTLFRFRINSYAYDTYERG